MSRLPPPLPDDPDLTGDSNTPESSSRRASAIEARVTELEIQLAYIQRGHEQLNEMVTRLTLDARRRDLEMQRLVDEVRTLKSKSDSGGGRAGSIQPEDSQYEENRPPHY